MPSLEEDLRAKIRTLSEEVWEHQTQRERIDNWLDNFVPDPAQGQSERLHALFLLSQFMYFGHREVRELLNALFRDLYKYPIVATIRRGNGDTTNEQLIRSGFEQELMRTRFLGIGNPSESGQHLLYYFRQENGLPKELFVNSHEIFQRTQGGQRMVRAPDVRRYVFIDDFCGSGKQARDYSRDIIEELKQLQPTARAAYYCLFATESGLDAVLRGTKFDEVSAVFELDKSYQLFAPESRYFAVPDPLIDRGFVETFCRQYGLELYPNHPLGFNDSQLLIGFAHNVPDNTLPIVWADQASPRPWTPIFRRYPKNEFSP